MIINWNEIYDVIKPLALFVLGMLAYSIFIFKFYRFMARKNIFKLNLKEKYGGVRKFFGGIWYTIEYLVVFPIAVFLWFAVVSFLLMILAKNQTTSGILLISMALVATIRITAYYHEARSQDLAKMLPFALLGVFLVDITFFSWSTSWELIKGIPDHWMTIIYYLVFIVALEIFLRVVSLFIPGRKEEEDKKKK